MRKLITNNNGSMLILAGFILLLVAAGALYTLFFLEIAIPVFSPMIPSSDSKTMIIMLIYAIPAIITIVAVISAFKDSLKSYYMGGLD